MPTEKNSSLQQRIWKALISIKLTIVLLILLSVVCIVGTVIPQNASTHEYLQLYSRSTYELFKTLGFTDLYHAWWFTFAMAVFTVNLVACTVNRMRATPRRRSTTPPPDRATLLARMCAKRFTFKRMSPEIERSCINAVTAFLAAPVLQTTSARRLYHAEKGRYARSAFYLTHLGVVIIIAGALLGNFGFQGYLQLSEGEASGAITLIKERRLQDLGFQVRCDKFEVSFYDEKRMPKDYHSTLTVLEDGREVLTRKIEVNDPLIYRGIYFYQSSYGTSGEFGEVELQVTSHGAAQQHTVRVKPGQRVALGDSGDELQLDRFVSDFTMDPQGRVFSRSDQPNNPAAQVLISAAGTEPYRQWVFARHAGLHEKKDAPYTIRFVNFYPAYYTGLQVTRDPGVLVVWVGCAIMLAGIYLAFFLSHRHIWLSIEEKDGGGYEIVCAGTSTKNRVDFTADFETLCETIKSAGKQ